MLGLRFKRVRSRFMARVRVSVRVKIQESTIRIHYDNALFVPCGLSLGFVLGSEGTSA